MYPQPQLMVTTIPKMTEGRESAKFVAFCIIFVYVHEFSEAIESRTLFLKAYCEMWPDDSVDASAQCSVVPAA